MQLPGYLAQVHCRSYNTFVCAVRLSAAASEQKHFPTIYCTCCSTWQATVSSEPFCRRPTQSVHRTEQLRISAMTAQQAGCQRCLLQGTCSTYHTYLTSKDPPGLPQHFQTADGYVQSIPGVAGANCAAAPPDPPLRSATPAPHASSAAHKSPYTLLQPRPQPGACHHLPPIQCALPDLPPCMRRRPRPPTFHTLPTPALPDLWLQRRPQAAPTLRSMTAWQVWLFPPRTAAWQNAIITSCRAASPGCQRPSSRCSPCSSQSPPY